MADVTDVANVNVLSKPRNVSHTLYKLNDWMEKGMINVLPEFQRDIKQSHLIDSILKNYYIPPIIFSCKKLDENRFMRICIDGKQRLTSINRQVRSAILQIIKEQNQYLILREFLECSEIVCIEYYDLTQTQEREIFSRVQLGVSLTPAEKLWAISSMMSDFLHKTYETYKIITQIMDTKRGKLFHIMAQLFFIIQNEPEKFNARPKIIEEYLRNTREIPINFQETIKQFVFISWIIAKNQKYSLIQYQECLLKMVREHHEDTRFNDKIYATLKRFMDNLNFETSSSSSSDDNLPAGSNLCNILS
ncbi:hypothetical protein F8M41_023177 [Gigaspora margarita]|uniref:GmrSD restriction endonucleases N-terminal domain-containing protein n=1 Tax=Gigaspora margarita TaxID=4874 RepID=A0A8H4ADW8_GIGMA|nr:hypothetical protein F8M41_023177 [Gigaspora margarita]